MLSQNSQTGEPVSDAPVTVRQDGPIAIITLNRPKARNSLSEAMLLGLADAIAHTGQSAQTHAAILRAEGPAFCAGHDLKELTAHRSADDRGQAYFEKIMRLCAEVMQAIVACPKPVIAAVQGTATAAGCQLVASCDLAVAASEAKFCTPGVNIGLFCSTPMVALSRNVPRKRAMEMLLLGDMISAEDAAAYGLINCVVDAEGVMEEAMMLAQKIAAKAPKVVAIGKRAFYEQAEMPLAQAYDYAAKVMVENMLMKDSEEGMNAFIEKRTPTWDPN